MEHPGQLNLKICKVRPLLLAWLVVGAVACGDDQTQVTASNVATASTSSGPEADSAGTDPQALSEAQDRWAASGTQNYQYESTTIDCECSLAGTLRVTVSDGSVVDLQRRDNPDSEYYALDASYGYTVEDLFAMIAEAEDIGILSAVKFHPEDGHPIAIEIGRGANDAHVGFAMTSFSRSD